MLRSAGRLADIFNVASSTASGEEVSEVEVQKGKDLVFEEASNENCIEKIAYARI